MIVSKSFEAFANLTGACSLVELGTTKKPFRFAAGASRFSQGFAFLRQKSTNHISRFFAAHATSYPCMQNATGAGRMEAGFLGTATCWKSWLHA